MAKYEMDSEVLTVNSVLIVIPVHNALTPTLDCLRSVVPQVSINDLLIVDNGSAHETMEALKEHFPKVAIISQSNLGYSAAANVGIAESVKRRYKYTWLLNSDTVILPETIRILVSFMDDVTNLRVGACSPIVHRADDSKTIDFAGGWLNRSDWSVAHISDPQRGDDALQSKPMETFLTGCALFIRNEAALDVGMFDERFFMYWEDCDFSVRLVNRGWGLRLVRSAAILHHIQGSAGGNGGRSVFSTYYESRNCFLLWREYTHGFVNRIITCLRMLHWIVTTFISRRITSMNDSKLAATEGVVDGLTGRFGQKTRSLTKRQAQLLAAVLWYLVLPLLLISDRHSVRAKVGDIIRNVGRRSSIDRY